MNNEKLLNEEKVYEKLVLILREAVPLKVIGEITTDTSLVDDLGFNSVEIMNILIKIQDVFFNGDARAFSVSDFLNDVYNNSNNRPLLIKAICSFILEKLRKVMV